MDRTAVVRAALWATSLWNLAGALQFLFPTSLGRLMGLPLPVSHFYTWVIASFIGVFGMTYVWLARQPEIDRPLMVVAAIGKTVFFAIAFAAWLLSELPVRGVALAAGDLAFAAIFVWWLLGERPVSSRVAGINHP